MNYDAVSSAQGRAQVPGQSSGRGYDSDAFDDYGPLSSRSEDTTGSVTGRASVGRASVGGAPVGRAPVGRAPVGTAPVSPASRPYAPPGPNGRGGGVDRTRSKRRRQRRRNIIAAAIAAFIMIAGVVIVGGTYYVDNVALPNEMPLKASTTIMYADGTEMARIGEQNRTIIAFGDMKPWVQHAVVAAEDTSFYTNDGIDYKGIIRAAWSNLTGGERQGASTITQQYARQVLELRGVSYGRKLREAVLAMKLTKKYSKDQILEFYLNTVYFGRHAYGIQAAAKAYFNKDAKDLTVAEGMVLACLIKQPEGTNGSPYDGSKNPETAKARWGNYLKPRMVKLNFMSQAEADKLEYPTIVPLDAKLDQQLRAQWGINQPSGLIVHQVMDEMSKITVNGKKLTPDEIRNGGLKITTTIDKNMQALAEKYANVDASGSPLYSRLAQPTQYQAALVAVEPGTGAVKAYYGGPTGGGSDYAGIYADPVLDNGKMTGFGAHPPGSSFKVYTLATGLMKGYKIDSYWDGSSPKEFPHSGRTKANPISNVEGNATCQFGTQSCQLWEAVEESLNTPFFALAEDVTAAKIIDVARAAGIRYMWDDKGIRHELTNANIADLSPKFFSTEVGIGQYGVTVLDHATGVATIANRGKAAASHFVQQIEQNGSRVYIAAVHPHQISTEFEKGKPVTLSEAMVDNMTWSLNKVVTGGTARGLDIRRPVAGKTGTWQFTNKTDNAHSWMVGYTPRDTARKSPGIAVAVWFGNKKDQAPLRFKNSKNQPLGEKIYGSSGAGKIWQSFLTDAVKSMPRVEIPNKKEIGKLSVGPGGQEPQQQGDGWPWDQNPGNGNQQPFPSQPGATVATTAPRRA